MPRVSVRASDGTDQQIPLGDRTVIGRAEDSDIYLPDQSLSRRHAEIHRRADGCYVLDLGSTNGTFLNGAPVPRERVLADGDEITVGEITLVFHARDARPGARSFPLTDLAVRATRGDERAEPLPAGRVLGILTQASGALLWHHPLPELFERILDMLLSAVPADRGAIMLVEGDPPVPVVKARRSRQGEAPLDHVSPAITRRVLDEHLALLLPDVLDDAGLRGRASILGGTIRSAMCVPLWVASAAGAPTRVLGLVYLDSHTREPSFTEADLEVLTVLANVAAAKIETARLLEESLEKRRLEEDLRLAAHIQDRILPRSAPVVPGFDVAASTRPCRTVGGDYFDLLLAGDRLHFALGDVAGKGLGAAMLMIALRAAVRAHWADGPLAEATARISATFHQNVPDDRYATFFHGQLEPATGQLTYVNAGHNQPLLVRAGGGLERLSCGGTVLGAFESSSFEDGTAALAPGDTLLVFSDGVSDTWPDADTADDALVKLVRRGLGTDAAGLIRQIFATVEQAGPARAPDDRTLLVVRRI